MRLLLAVVVVLAACRQLSARGSAQLEQMSVLQNLRGAGSASLRQLKLLALEKEVGMLSLTGASV